MGLKLTLLLMVACCFLNIQAALNSWIEYELAGFDNADGGLIKTNLKSKRMDKSMFVIGGTVEIITDFNDDWEAEVVLFHSAKGNNQFVKMPYKVPKDDLCKIVDGVYVKTGIAKDVAAVSDLPPLKDNESLCSKHKKGNYTIRQYVLGKSAIPKFLQTGYYKAHIIASKKNSDEVSTFVVHVKLY